MVIHGKKVAKAGQRGREGENNEKDVELIMEKLLNRVLGGEIDLSKRIFQDELKRKLPIESISFLIFPLR